MTYQHVLLPAIQQIPGHLLEGELLAAFQNQNVSPFLNVLKYASTKNQLLYNYSQSLRVAAAKERTSGFFRGSLGAMLTVGINKKEVAEILNIDQRSVINAMDLAQQKHTEHVITGKHNQFVKKTNYSVNRLPVQPSIITNWILSHCRASANSGNVVRKRDANGTWSFDVMHYRDSTVSSLFTEYKTEFPNGIGASKFYSLVPKCVYLQPYYSGLCPTCSAAYHWDKMLTQRRRQWHDRCQCTCTYCSTCLHGTACANDCVCSTENCPVEQGNNHENWTIPQPSKQLKNDRDKYAPNQMVHVSHQGTRSQFMASYQQAIDGAANHKLHVQWQKEVVKKLKKDLPWDTVMMRWDFLMNYSHVSSIEVGNAFYGRRQTTVLIATVWYHGPDSTEEEPVISKTHHAFVSPYLFHTSVVFQKAFAALLPLLDLHTDVTKCILLTDGGMQHFKNRRSMHWGTKVFDLLGLRLRWIIDPAYHGKGECDGRGALLKRLARIHVLKEDGFIDTPEDLAKYWDTIEGGSSTVLNIDYNDTEEDVTTVAGIKACYDFVFSREPNKLYMRQWPCTCESCLQFLFGECSNAQNVGDWIERVTKVVGVEHPKGTTPNLPLQNNNETEELYEVEALLEKRTYKNDIQYLVKFTGYSEEYNLWLSTSELQCDDLINQHPLHETHGPCHILLKHVVTSTKYPLPAGKNNHLVRYQFDNHQNHPTTYKIQVNLRELEQILHCGERPDWIGIIINASKKNIPYHYTFKWVLGSQISFPDCPYLGGVPNLAKWMKHVELTAYSPIEYIRLAKWAGTNTELMFEWDLNQVCTPNEFSEYTKAFSHQGGIVCNSLTDNWHHIKALVHSNPCNLDAVQEVAICKSKATLVICKDKLIPSQLIYYHSTGLKTFIIASLSQANETKYKDLMDADLVIVSAQFLKNNHYIAHKKSEAAVQHLIFADDAWKERPAPVLEFIHWYRLVSNVETVPSFSSSYVWLFEQSSDYKFALKHARLIGLTDAETYPEKSCMDYIELQIKIDYMMQNLLWARTSDPPFLQHRILDYKNEDIELTLSKSEEYLRSHIELTALVNSLSGGNFLSIPEFKTRIIKEQKLPSSHSLFDYKLEELQPLSNEHVDTKNIFPTEEQYPYEYALKQHGAKFAHLVKYLRKSFAEKDSCIIIASRHKLLLKKLADELLEKFHISYAYHQDVKVGDRVKVILFNFYQLDSFQPYTIDPTTIIFAEPVDQLVTVRQSHVFARVNPKVVNNLTVVQFYVKDSFEQYPWESQRRESNNEWCPMKTPVLLKSGHTVLSNFLQIVLANNTINSAK